MFMGAITKGAIVGGAANAVSGDGSIVEGATKGAAAGGAVKVGVPLITVLVVGYVVYKLVKGRSGRSATSDD
jgi:hypothetical protein